MSIEENIKDIAECFEEGLVPTRMYITTHIAAALLPMMGHATRYEIAHRAAELADAIIDETVRA